MACEAVTYSSKSNNVQLYAVLQCLSNPVAARFPSSRILQETQPITIIMKSNAKSCNVCHAFHAP